MTKGKKLFTGARKRLDDLVNKIQTSFGGRQKNLLENFRKEYTSFKKKGYNVNHYIKFYKEESEKRRKKFNKEFIHRAKEYGLLQ